MLSSPGPLLAGQDSALKHGLPAGSSSSALARAPDTPVVAETLLVGNANLKGAPDVSGDLVVYHEQPTGGTYAVYAVVVGSGSPWALSSPASASQMMPRVHGSNVVWTDWRVPSAVRPGLYRYAGGANPQVSQVSTVKIPDSSPAAIHGRFVAYSDRTATPWRIRLKDLQSEQEIFLGATPPGRQDFPSAADGLIAFQEVADDARHHVKVFSYSVANGQLGAQQILNTRDLAPTSSQMRPQISGSAASWTLVWQDTRGGSFGIYGYRSGGSQFPISVGAGDRANPAISGDLVVWQDRRSDSNYDIYGYDLARQVEFPVCTAGGDQTDPRVSGSRVVWADKRSSVWDIYTATVQWPAATSTPTSTGTATATSAATATSTQTAAPIATETVIPTATPTDTSTPTATAAPTETPTPTVSSTSTYTPTPTASATPAPTPTSTPTSTATASPAPTPTATAMPTSSPTATASSTTTFTPSPTPTSTSTATATATATSTATSTSTPTPVPTATLSPTATSTPTPAAVGPGHYEDGDPRVQYSGIWTDWVGHGPEGGTARRSSTTGATAELRFLGSRIGWLTARGPGEGVAEVWIDAVRMPEVDLYRPGSMRWQELVSYLVPHGEHRIAVIVTSSRNVNSSGYDVVIDGFLVDLAPTPTATGTATWTPTPTASCTPSPSPSDTPTATPSATPTPTEVPTATETPLPTNTPTPTDTPIPTSTPTQTATPTETPAATPYITGVVDLQARADNSGAVVSAGPYLVTTDSEGVYLLPLPPGVYTVTVSCDGYLKASKAGVVVEGTGKHTLPSLKLWSGNPVNVGGSANYVSTADLELVEELLDQAAPGGPDEDSHRADFNRDGIVDLLDLVAVASNWHKRASDYDW